jgi:hypothetical protein
VFYLSVAGDVGVLVGISDEYAGIQNRCAETNQRISRQDPKIKAIAQWIGKKTWGLGVLA